MIRLILSIRCHIELRFTTGHFLRVSVMRDR